MCHLLNDTYFTNHKLFMELYFFSLYLHSCKLVVCEFGSPSQPAFGLVTQRAGGGGGGGGNALRDVPRRR